MGLVSVVQQDVSKVLRGGIAIANVGGLLTSASVVNEVELNYLVDTTYVCRFAQMTLSLCSCF